MSEFRTVRSHSWSQKDVAAVLRSTPRSLQQMLIAADKGLLWWRPADEAWCIIEIVGHMLHADEHAFEKRIRWMLDHPGGMIPQESPAVDARASGDDADLRPLLQEWIELREGRASFVEQLPAAAMAVTGALGQLGTFSVADFVYEWAWHDCSHFEQVLGNLRAYILPEFGIAMKRALAE